MGTSHIQIQKIGEPINFTVADGTAINKGDLLKFADPRTASLSLAANDIIAGVAAADKIANDGVTQLAVWRSGIFQTTASGAIVAGDTLAATGTAPNFVSSRYTIAVSGSQILGIALETAATNETFLYELRPGAR